ncbi:MAG: hypothetical protein H7Z19_01960 [Chitinophagaceae bacterium]|nr:hypothetical protein [Rubrivivax sp.]
MTADIQTPGHGDIDARVRAIAADLRRSLTPLVEALAGTPPRPVRLMRRTGLDKSLASRLVQAIRADGDPQFLHACPSPTGLRLLLESSVDQVAPALQQGAELAVDRFEDLVGALPGGRQTLDALLGDSTDDIRRKREHVARQASFKAVSFLFGHYCDVVATTLFIVPSATPGKADFLEVHRRVGLQRLVAGGPIALMSLHTVDPDAPPVMEACVTDLAGNATTRRPEDFLLAAASSQPLPALSTVGEGSILTFVLDPAPPSASGQHLSLGMRVLRASDMEPAGCYVVPRRYMLHTPCRTLVRDIYLAEGLWPDARLQVDFYMPGPTGSPGVELEPGRANHRKVQLSCDAQMLPTGPVASSLEGVPDHAQTMRDALRKAGLADQRFRGWRCEMVYPVPLIEMQIGFCFGIDR